MRSLIFLLFFAPLWAQEVVPGRFIVELNGEPAAQRATRSARRAAIAQEQGAIERGVRAMGGRVTGSVDIVANAVIVDGADRAALARMPGVRKVYPVRKFRRLMLDYEREIHQVGQAWSEIGGDLKAGEGVKIAILDSGIHTPHRAFNQPDLPVPEGFPKGDREWTNNKVIVARSYDGASSRDRAGHGTAVASVAAAAPHVTSAGLFAGVAPRAWLGSYRIEDVAGEISDEYILRALNDAVGDGMDVINMSFGAPGFGQQSEITLRAFERCLGNGIILVRAAGNTPGPMTVDDDASYERVIAVGATQTSRVFTAASVVPSVGPPLPGEPASNSFTVSPLSGPVADIASGSDPEGLGCNPLPPDSLSGRIAIIRRGTCLFSEKMLNVQSAGAVAAIVYNSPMPADGSSPDEYFVMAVTGDGPEPSIPGIMIGNSNGRRLLELAKSVEDFSVQVRFGATTTDPRRLASFSSRGPGFGLAIKPDLAALGVSVNAAVLTAENSFACSPFTDILCSTSGYDTPSGTSFSSPYVAGAAAVLKSARKDLSVDEYRSLIVNSTNSVDIEGAARTSVQAAGAGHLNLHNALRNTLAAAPVSISYASGGSSLDLTRKLRLKNLSSEASTVTLSVDSSDEFKPSVSPGSLTLQGGQTAEVDVVFQASSLPDGAYQGFIIANTSLNGVPTRIPYWYGTTTPDIPVTIIVYQAEASAALDEDVTVYVRIHNASGLSLSDIEPKVTPLTTGATVASVRRTDAPNIWEVRVRPGQRGTNSWRVEAGEINRTFSVTGR